MKILAALCILAALSATGIGQTIKALGYNMTNGQVIYANTNVLTFTSAISFGTNAATTRSNLGAVATNGDAAGLTNFPASLLRTNGSGAGLTNFPESLLRTNGSAAGLTNFPASLLTTNGSAANLTNFPSELLRTNGDGSGLTNIAVDAENITGTVALASNVTETVALTNGGTGATNETGARDNLGLGSGITTNIFWYDLDTNYHDLTISNGIITGYSQ
jgi:hypothetical protein